MPLRFGNQLASDSDRLLVFAPRDWAADTLPAAQCLVLRKPPPRLMEVTRDTGHKIRDTQHGCVLKRCVSISRVWIPHNSSNDYFFWLGPPFTDNAMLLGQLQLDQSSVSLPHFCLVVFFEEGSWLLACGFLLQPRNAFRSVGFRSVAPYGSSLIQSSCSTFWLQMVKE